MDLTPQGRLVGTPALGGGPPRVLCSIIGLEDVGCPVFHPIDFVDGDRIHDFRAHKVSLSVGRFGGS